MYNYSFVKRMTMTTMGFYHLPPPRWSYYPIYTCGRSILINSSVYDLKTSYYTLSSLIESNTYHFILLLQPILIIINSNYNYDDYFVHHTRVYCDTHYS